MNSSNQEDGVLDTSGFYSSLTRNVQQGDGIKGKVAEEEYSQLKQASLLLMLITYILINKHPPCKNPLTGSTKALYQLYNKWLIPPILNPN